MISRLNLPVEQHLSWVERSACKHGCASSGVVLIDRLFMFESPNNGAAREFLDSTVLLVGLGSNCERGEGCSML